jgi:hypothetical protein
MIRRTQVLRILKQILVIALVSDLILASFYLHVLRQPIATDEVIAKLAQLRVHIAQVNGCFINHDELPGL